jgi:hypothetical protein
MMQGWRNVYELGCEKKFAIYYYVHLYCQMKKNKVLMIFEGENLFLSILQARQY